MNNNKYKIEVPPKKPQPKQKVTGISWDEMVEVIAENGIGITKKIRLHNVGVSKGTELIKGPEMLALWKAVAHKKSSERNQTSCHTTA